MGEFSLLSIQAWNRFFGRGELPVDQVGQAILRSWLRCVEAGLDQSRPPHIELPGRYELQILRERHERLSRLCRPELDALNAEARDTHSIVILTNAQGMVLDAVGDVGFAGQAAEVALRPGIVWSESSMGTNAIGAALAERRAVAVHGAEHFFESHHILTCAAIPITDPRGVVIGALNLSAHAMAQHIHALGLVRFAVDQIEHRLFSGSAFDGYRVLRFHTDPAVIGAVREAILVFDETQHLIAGNRRGLSFVQRDWSALDTARFEDLFSEAPKQATRPAELTGRDGGRFFGIMTGPLGPGHRAKASELVWDSLDMRVAKPATPDQKLRDAEVSAMKAALDACGGNVSRAARRLGVHRSTLYRRLFDAERMAAGRGALEGSEPLSPLAGEPKHALLPKQVPDPRRTRA